MSDIIKAHTTALAALEKRKAELEAELAQIDEALGASAPKPKKLAKRKSAKKKAAKRKTAK